MGLRTHWVVKASLLFWTKVRETGVVVWDSKGGKAIHMEMEKQTVGKHKSLLGHL